MDLGRRRRDRHRRRRGPGHRRRRRPGRAVPAVARIDRVLRADRLPLDDRRADHRRGGPLGVIEVYVEAGARRSARPTPSLVGALASQAAIAITNARLIEELEQSRAEVARQADTERTLREIAARVSAILEPDEVLQQIVDEATRLLESDGARIDLYDPEIDALRWSYAAGDAMSVVPDWAADGGLKPGQAVAGTAFAEQRPARTDDYLADERFLRDDLARDFVDASGIRSVVAVPLAGDGAPLGTLSVVSRRRARTTTPTPRS